MSSLLKKIFKRGSNRNYITIVSGLPRSGTSMMMKMLEAGGIEVVTDNIRKADEDNPKGYYEFEKAKKIKEDKSWLDDCKNKVVKMVSMLLFNLPSDRKYRVVFMRRNMKEILASQRKMLQRLDKEDNDVSDKEMAKNFERHLRDIINWLDKQENIDVLYVNYNEIIADPKDNIRRLNKFFGNILDIKKMMTVVDKNLYRQRK